MSTHLPLIYRDFPQYECVRHFTASLPLFHVKVATRILERRPLPFFSQSILRAINLGDTTIVSLAHHLGLDDIDVIDGVAELLMAELLDDPIEDGKRQIALTSKGKEILANEGQMATPSLRSFEFHFNPLTRTLHSRYAGVLRAQSDAFRDKGEFIIPATAAAPTRNTLTLDTVRDALTVEDASAPSYDVLDVLGLSDVYLEYLPGVEVFVLRHRDNRTELLLAFHGGQGLQGVSSALQAKVASDEQVVPGDAYSVEPDPVDLALFLPGDVAKAVQEYMDQSRRAARLERQVAGYNAVLHSLVETTPERQRFGDELARLRENVAVSRNRRETALVSLCQLQRTAPKILEGKHYTEILEETIKKAEREILIVSRWVGKDVVTESVRKQLGNATRRNVDVFVGYDFGPDKRHGDDQRLYGFADDLYKRLEEECVLAPQVPTDHLHMSDVGDVGVSIFVRDTSIAVIAEFPFFRFLVEDTGIHVPPQGIALTDTDTIEFLTARVKEMYFPGVA